jgi:hypothetical protein
MDAKGEKADEKITRLLMKIENTKLYKKLSR